MFASGCQVGIPTEAGLPHAMGNAFRNVAALVADIDFTFKEARGKSSTLTKTYGTILVAMNLQNDIFDKGIL